MGITGENKPLQGDPLESAHAAIPAGAIDGELYAAAPTTAPVATAAGSGVVSFTSGEYHITFAIRNPVTDAILGETTSGSISNTVTPDPVSKTIDITAIPVSPNDHINCRRIYRDSGSGTFRLVGEILDNITTTFTDNVLDTTSQPVMPTTNTTGHTITGNVPTASTALNLKEEGTERFKVNSKGIIRKGITNFAMPWSYDDIVGYQARDVTNAGFTTAGSELLAITGLSGTDITGGSPQFIIGGVVVATMVTAATDKGVELNNPILVAASTLIESSGTPAFSLCGTRITDTGHIVPFIKTVTSPVTTTASKITVILGYHGLGVTEEFEVEMDDDPGVFADVAFGESMTYNTALDSRMVNKITMPIILEAGVDYDVGGLGGTVWGYEIDA